ncbi:LysR family transcriptional regulator [Vibrio tritonius]|uniref:LysR family transcriptional regulator n=1 Tax=Vibrio tritonius TaxID=1435069 RepID=UPI0008388C33|nr:LysR family transcriptional regulator [Vibrio tritonius]
MRHLKAFYVFHITAESLTYSEAAEKLHITHGAVSKQIKLLEQHLSQTLFYKKGRNMLLTTEGQLLKQYTDKAFGALRNGVTALTKKDNVHLDVSCEPTLTMRWLMPRLASFYQQTGIDVRLSTAGGPVTLSKDGISLAIRRDDFELNPDYVPHLLTTEYVGPVTSPEYWSKIKDTLESCTLLHSNTRPTAWSDWLAATKTHRSKPNEKSFEHFYFCLQAASDGLGIAMGSYPLVVDDIKRGRLIAPFGFIESGHNYVLISQHDSWNQHEQAFANWLQLELAQLKPTPIED